MHTLSSSTKAMLKSYIMDVFLKDYDVPTLESLLRNMGEQKALHLLKYCDQFVTMEHRMDLSYLSPIVQEQYVKRYGNIYFLMLQAIENYKGDKGAMRFKTEIEPHIQMYHKTAEEVEKAEQEGNVVKHDEVAVKKSLDRKVFRACYIMATIYQSPQRERIITAINGTLNNGVLEQLFMAESRNLIPVELRGIANYTLVLETVIKRVLGKDALDKIDIQGQKDRCKAGLNGEIPAIIF